ncbi:MAG: LysM peptidoglycan-binding domain-containing protein [Bacteriovoracia bacterium]
MKKIIAQVTVLSVFANYGFAQDFYTVKRGDTLSHIVKRNYPYNKLYGRRGKLAEVLQNNPHIKNPNLIFPNQKIHFVPVVVIEPTSSVADSIPVIVPEETTPIVETKPEVTPEAVEVSKQGKESRKVSELKGIEEWNISALYGAKYLSVSQTGALGKAEVGVLFLNDLKLNSEFIFEDWSFGFQIDSYKFKYEALSSGDSKQMYALNLYGSYKWFIGGINIEQNPLFRNNNGSIEMTKMTLMYLSLGLKQDFELPTRKPTTLKLKSWVNYPLSASSDNADIKLDSVKGFGVTGQAELNRQILAREEYSLHATWQTQLGIQKITQDVEWDVSKGEAKSSIVDASTAIGLLFKF